MPMEEITLALSTACNSILAYIPQILKAATDRNGASSISFASWCLFLVANVSTVAYALINRADFGLATCFAGNAICCLVIQAVTYWKRRHHARRLHHADRTFPATA